MSYAADYADMSAPKKFADAHGTAILCVHHNRKMDDQDVFNTVSGTNGITGAADCTMVLSNLNRASKHATLSVTGRDVEFQEYKVKLTDCVWELIEKTSKEELEERDVPDDVLRTLDFMMTQPVEWKGTTTELFNAVGGQQRKCSRLWQAPGAAQGLHGRARNPLRQGPHARGKHPHATPRRERS